MTGPNGSRGERHSPAQDDFAAQRAAMIESQVRARGVRDPRVLDAMLRIPRHLFVPAALAGEAYTDQPLSIGEEQTISQPFIVAAMTEALELAGAERVLEIGTGSGYQTAMLAHLTPEVISIEMKSTLAAAARERLARMGFVNVTVICGDGSAGYAGRAPYDAILVTAAAPAVPPPLVDQLAEGGRLVIPVGPPDQQELLRVRKSSGRTTRELLHYCRFVPLLGSHGWPEGEGG
jgi:protein-L-isoaspartate(D-aspartate) O-methyltransferase